VDAELSLRHVQPLGGDGRRELAGLPDDHVGPPLRDRREHARERGAGLQPDEQLLDHVRGARRGVRRPHRRPRRVPLARRRLADGPERQPRAPDRQAGGSRAGDEHVVACARAGVREGHDRTDVAGPGRRCEEDPHAAETSRPAIAFPAVRR
jgi:hypothetical protein